MILTTYDAFLKRQIAREKYIVHAVFLNVASRGERLSVGLLIVKGDRPWFEVVVRRRYPVGVYDEGDRIRIVEDDNYITNRAYNLLAVRHELYGSLVMRNPYGIAGSLYLTPPMGQLRMNLSTGTLRLHL